MAGDTDAGQVSRSPPPLLTAVTPGGDEVFHCGEEAPDLPPCPPP